MALPCLDCPGLSFDSQEAIAQHRRDEHPAPVPWIERPKFCVADHGKAGKKRQYWYLDRAWIGAFISFALYGYVLTPYRCSSIKINGRAVRKSCNAWHLTSQTPHILPPPKAA